MKAIGKAIRGFTDDESGAALVEYALLVALIAIVAVVALAALGTTVSGKISEMASKLS